MFRKGEKVFVPGSSGEPAGVMAVATRTADVEITTSFVPGVNTLPVQWASGVTVSGPFAYFGSGYRHLPVSYAGMAMEMDQSTELDTVVVQVSPPDRNGLVTLGPAAEFAPIALRRAHRKIAVVNMGTPRFCVGSRMPITGFDTVLEQDTPLAVYETGSPGDIADAIAARAAEHIGDGATLQVGLGKIPSALLRLLTDRRDLKLHSGMLSDGTEALVDAGALAPGSAHRTTVFLGSKSLYDWAAGQDVIHVEGCEHIHAPAILAALDGLIAVNSALEVDLLGQCNLETAGARQISGGGGATDFARAARLSANGLSIVAMPATGGAGRSRIVPRLGVDSLVTLGRNDIDLVVTEHGVADLRGLPAHQRAEALIHIADPNARPDLWQAWRDMARKLGF